MCEPRHPFIVGRSSSPDEGAADGQPRQDPTDRPAHAWRTPGHADRDRRCRCDLLQRARSHGRSSATRQPMTDPVTVAWMSRSRARWVAESSTPVVRPRETGVVPSTPGTTPTPKQFRLSAGSRGFCRRDTLAIHGTTLVWPPSAKPMFSRSHCTRRIRLSGERAIATQAVSPNVTANQIAACDTGPDRPDAGDPPRNACKEPVNQR